MTADDFRKIALSCPEAIESSHMNHPDFRVRGKIFATLGYPDEHGAVVKLTSDDQERFIRTNRRTFHAVKGAWGRRGATTVHLPTADVVLVGEAVAAAWRNIAPKRLVSRKVAK